jgi:energy-coupling factor transporter ATP-binding protein EcfA2
VRRISRISIRGLFGYLDHDISLRVDEPTIFTGPNGVGKTNVLTLVEAALKLDIRGLVNLPFSRLDIVFDDGRSLVANRMLFADGPTKLTMLAKRGNRRIGETFETTEDDVNELPDIPRWIEELGDGRWYDSRQGTVIPSRLVERRYGVKLHQLSSRGRFELYPEILSCVDELEPILIDTKRLDTLAADSASPPYSGETQQRPRLTRIHQYIYQIRTQVEEARRASVVATQSADLSFASRALAAAHARVKVTTLYERYNAIVEQYEDLSQNGLAIGEAPLEIPENTTPTIRRILNVFLDDWEKRLEPLRPVNSKLNLLRRILDGKLAVTGKTTRMTERGLLQFTDLRGKSIQVSKLSSGEQHLIALFAMLLFSARPASIVLIDEPEISLHAAWKHSFLDDISEVARLANLQIVLATHSSGIINGRWDLTEELSYRPMPPDADDERSVEQEAEEEFE